MAEQKPLVEIVTNTDRCSSIVREILTKHNFVAVDAEGVNLGKTGPLTLLQVGTPDNHVYLFDVETTKSLLGAGPLKDLLESDKVVKIIHSCKGDSAALRAQFGITLQNVFDTQVAHTTIEESKGRRLPPELKLVDICELYGAGSKELAGKEAIKEAWTTIAGYWAIRPLTKEMVEYATADVHVLFPVYETQLRNLRERGIYEEFKGRVADDILVFTRPDIQRKKQDKLTQNILIVIQQIQEKHGKEQIAGLSDLSQDQERAVWLNREETAFTKTSIWKALRREKIEKYVMETKQEMTADPHLFGEGSHYGVLLKLSKQYKGSNLGDEMDKLMTEIRRVTRNNIIKKYRSDTPLEYIRSNALGLIRNIRIDSESNHILIALFNRLFVQDLTELEAEYTRNPREFTMNKSQYHTIRHMATKSRRCSPEVKTLSQRLWRKFVQQYGREKGF